MNRIPLVSHEQLESEHRLLTPLADTFCTEVSRQLNRLLADANVTLGFPIEYRVKTWESIAEKLERKTLQLETLADLHDLVGLRIVLLFRRDVDVTCAALEQNFDVLDNYDTQERLRDDQFGYSSRHFIVRLPEPWLAIPTFSQLGALRAEIQVRTVAQHIWAAASHNLQYKQEQNVPVPVRRSISRVSALLETVDLELERVLNEREEYRATLAGISVEEIVENPEADLDVDLLQRLLAENFPPENKREDEDYGALLQDLLLVGIRTSGQLQELIAENYDKVKREEQSYVGKNRESLKKGEKVSGTTEDRVVRGVYFTHVGLARLLLEHSGHDGGAKRVTSKRRRAGKPSVPS
jgi:putative GTP pyrophosphokinase